MWHAAMLVGYQLGVDHMFLSSGPRKMFDQIQIRSHPIKLLDDNLSFFFNFPLIFFSESKYSVNHINNLKYQPHDKNLILLSPTNAVSQISHLILTLYPRRRLLKKKNNKKNLTASLKMSKQTTALSDANCIFSQEMQNQRRSKEK